jgi:single-stranded-DNA-specific exonuclease
LYGITDFQNIKNKMADIPDNWRLRCPLSDRDIKGGRRDKESKKYSKSFLEILVLRNLFTEESIEEFLNPQVKSLYDPYLLSGMERGVKRLIKAITNKEKVSVFGDYDADGIISSALIYNFLKKFGLDTDIYIPDRFEEGYDLNLDYVKLITEKKKYSLIISVDCGTNNHEVQQFLRDEPKGPDVIVCDHHNASFKECPEDEKYIIINPKILGCKYPFKSLSGAGVSFKFITGVLRKLDNGKKAGFKKDYLSSLLDLVAISTIADVVPLIDENRVLVKKGLQRINKKLNKGLKILIETAIGNSSNIDEYDIGFIIAPRINAAGRMNNAMDSFNLFSEGVKDLTGIAKKLDNFNKERQILQAEIIEDIMVTYDLDEIAESKRIFIAYSDKWSEGVLGIVASEIVKRFNIPVLLFREKRGKLKGSGRSKEGFDLYGNLLEVKNLFEKFGGHRQACGISMDASMFNEFSKRFSNIAKKKISRKDLKRKYEYDIEHEFADIDMGLLEELEMLKPYGEANPIPVFLTRNCSIRQFNFLKDGKHLKMILEKDGISFKGLIFSIDSRKKEIIEKKQVIDILYSLQLNTWKGSKSIQLIIKDIY